MQQSLLMDNVMVLLLASIIISVILGWFTLKVAPKIGLMDIPGSAEHKNHKIAIPLTGGIVLVDTIFILMLKHQVFDQTTFELVISENSHQLVQIKK